MASSSGVSGSSVSEVLVGTGEAWAPFIKLTDLLNQFFDDSDLDLLVPIQEQLSLLQPNFRSLQNARPRSAADREVLKKSTAEAIHLKGQDGKAVLPNLLVQEALLVSDLLEINEFQALDLLVTGEAEMTNYPGWGRGLIAVYFYFQGRNALYTGMHLMLRVSPGHAWGSRVNSRLLIYLMPYLQNLERDNVVDRALDILTSFDAKKLLETLDTNLALGDWRHRTELVKHITSIRVELAQVVFCITAQQNIVWKDTLRILEYLKAHVTLKENVKLTKDDILLIASVLYSIENNINGDVHDKTFALQLKKYLIDAEIASSYQCPELLDLLKLAYHISAYKFLTETTVNSIYCSPNPVADVANDLLGDEELEFKTDIFNFLKLEVFTAEDFLSDEEHVLRRFHMFITDFINHMPVKLQEMRSRSEDAAKTAQIYMEQGLARPLNLPNEYENFLECVGTFYRMDKEFGLARDYFTSQAVNVALCKFIRSLCSDIPAMFVCNTKVLAGLSCSYSMGVFSLVKQSGHNMSLDHFFESIMKYLMSFGTHRGTDNGPVFQSDAFNRVINEPMKALNPNEILGIIAYLELIHNLCYSLIAQTYFIEGKKQWIEILLTAGRIRALPREVRAEMLETAAVMLRDTSREHVASLWDLFYSAKLIDWGSGDLKDELEEKETRLESYTLTISFLKLFEALVKLRFSSERALFANEDLGLGDQQIDQGALVPYVNYVRDSVFLKLPYRSYKDIKERWETAALSLSIMSRLLDAVPSLMLHMLSDSPLCRTTMCCLVDCTKLREMSTGPIPHVDKCSWEALHLIQQVVKRQDSYLYTRSASPNQVGVVFGIHDILMNIHPESGKSEYLLAILKFIDQHTPQKHRETALEILTSLVSGHPETDIHLYSTVISDPAVGRILRHTLSECLASGYWEVKKNVLELLRCSVIHDSPNFGLYLLCVEKKIDFQNPGVNGYPKTILHTILENATRMPDVFLTFLVFLRDDRLRGPLLRYLRSTQFFVKYYLESFPGLSYEATGHFLKCISIELKCCSQVGPMAHALVAQESNKFLNILNQIEVLNKPAQLPQLEFFEQIHVTEVIQQCETLDPELKVKIIDLKKLEHIFRDEISKLERSTALRLKKSVLGEATNLLKFAEQVNKSRKEDASKIILFDCWRQCLEVIILQLDTLKLAGVDFVTSILRLVVDKVVKTEGASEAFQRLAAETTMTLCGVLIVFKEDLSETVLNLILSYLCQWTSSESSSNVRAILYPSLLNVLKIMRDQKKSIANRSAFALLVEGLCKDTLYASDIGKMLSLYLLGEIIQWSLGTGIPQKSFAVNPLDRRGSGLSMISTSNTARRMREDEAEVAESALDVSALGDAADIKGFGDISSIVESPRSGKGDFNSGFKHMDKKRIVEHFHSTAYGLVSPSTLSRPDYFQFSKPEPPRSVVSDNQQESFQLGSNFTTQSTVMNFMYKKGLLRHLIENLVLVDDKNLLELFSKAPGSVHIRSLLIFEAKIFMFSQFAKTGPASALILMQDNLINKLADMRVFGLGGYLGQVSLNESELAQVMDNPVFEHVNVVPMSHPQTEQIESLITSVLSLFHSMVAAAPKNMDMVNQVWTFISTHHTAFEALLHSFPKDNSVTEVKECFTLFVSLMAEIAQKIPETALPSKSPLFRRMVFILKEMGVRGLLNNPEAQIKPIREIMQFLFNYATNVQALAAAKWNRRPITCRIVLASKMEYDNLRVSTEEELTVGNILRLVELAAGQIQIWEGSEAAVQDLYTIVETGLTLVNWHVAIAMKELFSSTPREGKAEQKEFQGHLATYMEDTLIQRVSDAVADSPKKDFILTMLSRLRRLAHLQKY